MKELLVLRVISKLLIPFILLFGLYVQGHGDYGPGGGFQAGVIFGAGFALYGIVFGLDTLRKVVPLRVIAVFVSIGLMLYVGVGYATMLLGGNYLAYGVLAEDPTYGQHYGILAIELGVGITVASVMILIFLLFAGRGDQR